MKTPVKRVTISYSHHDEIIVEAIKELLINAKLEVNIDKDVLGLGIKWFETMFKTIRTSSCLLFVVTPESLESEAVKSEIIYAQLIAALKQKKAFILPLIVKPCDKLPPWLTNTVYADFVNHPDEASNALLKSLGLI